MFQAITEQSVANRQMNLDGAYTPPTHKSARASDKMNQFGEACLRSFFLVPMSKMTVALPHNDKLAMIPRTIVSQSGTASDIRKLSGSNDEFQDVSFDRLLGPPSDDPTSPSFSSFIADFVVRLFLSLTAFLNAFFTSNNVQTNLQKSIQNTIISVKEQCQFSQFPKLTTSLKLKNNGSNLPVALS